MRCGHFDDRAREYVITDPRTPVKWINYVGTLDFGGFVDHTGGALICRGDPATNRITRYIALQPASDFKATTVYLRIRGKSGYTLLSPFFVPGLQAAESFECHVGLGYTRIVSLLSGIRCEATFLVPLGERRLLLDITLTNAGVGPVEMDVIPVVEYTHFDALKQLTNADWVPQTMQSRARRVEGGRIVLSQYAFMMRDTRVNFLSSSLPVSSFETERPAFLGGNEYGTWAAPESLRAEELEGHEALRGDNIGALMHRLGPVEPGGVRRLIVQLGQAESVEKALPGIERYWDPRETDRALGELAAFWDAYLCRQQAQTPDPDTDRMINIHAPRQCHTTLSWSRYLSLYQLGYGSRGIGFRDSSQDAMGVLTHSPSDARALIEKLLHVQMREGCAMHQLNPATMEGSMGDAREREDRPQYYSDDHLWGVLAVCEYLKETGDYDLLKKTIPFHEKDASGAPRESASVLEHLHRAIQFTRANLGAHGLPLLGFADWNDTVNLAAGAESVLTACLYGAALNEMAALAEATGDGPSAARVRLLHEEMSRRVNEHAWDGEWYVAYFDADGSPLGSRACDKGRIYSYPQSWAVMSGFAAGERALGALESVRRLLDTANGIKVSAPGFDGFDPAKGGITTYPPGAKENCGIFLHTNPWVIIAETQLGNGDRAYRYYRQVNPALKNDRIEGFQCEPYAYPQNILGDEHPLFGLARNSWLSGTASWMHQAAGKHILGLRPAHGGLLLDPCIPSAWDGFTAQREFRGARYAIEVKNPFHLCRGVHDMTVDGMRLDGNLLPAYMDNSIHIVTAVME